MRSVIAIATTIVLSTSTSLARAEERIPAATDEPFAKSGRFEMTPLVFTSLSGQYVNYAGAAASLAYHFSELLGVELNASIPGLMFPAYTELVREVYDYESLGAEDINLKQMDFMGTLNVQVAPLTGRADLYSLALAYHLYVVAGVGMVRTLEPCALRSSECSEDVGIGQGLRRPEDGTKANRIAGNFGFGLRLALARVVGVRLELRDLVFSDHHKGAFATNEGVSKTKHHLLLFLGASFMI